MNVKVFFFQKGLPFIGFEEFLFGDFFGFLLLQLKVLQKLY